MPVRVGFLYWLFCWGCSLMVKCCVCKTKRADVKEPPEYYCASCWLKVYAKNVRPILKFKSKKKLDKVSP